jgi:hypothetical protein
MDVTTVAKRLHRGCVQEVGPALDRARYSPIFEQE